MNPTALLENLVRYYSPTGNEMQAVQFLCQEMERMGYAAHIDAVGNVVGTRGNGPREILLLGHIDTVPGKIEVRSEGDLLYGRGTVDAKGPLACFTAAVAQITPPAGWRVTVIGAVGEEGDSRGAKYLCQNHPAPERVIIGEPSGWDRITLGYKGSTWMRYTVRFATSHSAGYNQTASELAFQFWHDLKHMADAWNAPYTRQFDQFTPTLFKMNTSTDGLCDTAILNINLRHPLTVDEAKLRSMLSSVANLGSYEWDEFLPAYRAEKNTALVRAFLSAIRKTNGQPAFALKTGSSDMNLVVPLWNCPSVAYGPGDATLDHTPNEHISKTEYLRSIDVLVKVVEDLLANSADVIAAKQNGKEKKPDENLVSRVIPA